jgi:hypothetical protein
MHQHTTDTEYLGGIEQSETSVTYQCPTDTSALVGPVDSQSTKYSD